MHTLRVSASLAPTVVSSFQGLSGTFERMLQCFVNIKQPRSWQTSGIKDWSWSHDINYAFFCCCTGSETKTDDYSSATVSEDKVTTRVDIINPNRRYSHWHSPAKRHSWGTSYLSCYFRHIGHLSCVWHHCSPYPRWWRNQCCGDSHSPKSNQGLTIEVPHQRTTARSHSKEPQARSHSGINTMQTNTWFPFQTLQWVHPPITPPHQPPHSSLFHDNLSCMVFS